MKDDINSLEIRAEAHRMGFDAAFDAHYASVLAFALRRVTGRGDAEDVAAETFAVAWRRREEGQAELPWLYAVAANVISNQRRSGRRRFRLRSKLATQPPVVGRDPADSVAERDAVANAFAQLSEDQRELLRLVCWEGLTSEDAAVALGCSPVAFRARLHRAKTKLAQHLEPAGHESDVDRMPTPPTALKETR